MDPATLRAIQAHMRQATELSRTFGPMYSLVRSFEPIQRYLRLQSGANNSSSSKWNLWSDPTVPAEFKSWYKAQGANRTHHPHSLERIAARRYLLLAQEHWEKGLGPIRGVDQFWPAVKGEYWQRFRSVPTHRDRVLKGIGLGSLLLPRGKYRRPEFVASEAQGVRNFAYYYTRKLGIDLKKFRLTDAGFQQI